MIDKNIARNWLEKSHLLRILLLCFLILLLQIPINMIENLIHERSSRHNDAIAEVSAKWGQKQSITGPMLIIPYQYREKTYKDGVLKYETPRKRFATFLPARLSINGNIEHDIRSRGIFEVPLYQAKILLDGSFTKPDFTTWNINDKDILWKESKLVIGVSDARAIQKQAYIKWQDEKYPFEPGTHDNAVVDRGFHVPLTVPFDAKRFNFSISLELNGSQSVRFAPVGKDTDIILHSDWPDPSFQGNWLPSKRTVFENGFKANWNIPYLGRNFPQQWIANNDNADKIDTAQVGVDFLTPVDNYRMSERSVKYESLFLLLTFATIWLFELICKLRVHPVQYLFIGAAMCLFYFLELSLSEHLGFFMAYVSACIAIVCMISSYAYVILKTGARASIVGGGISMLYVYLYVLLQEQSYALLIGSIGLFIVLASVMYLTRNIDWYAANENPAE